MHKEMLKETRKAKTLVTCGHGGGVGEGTRQMADNHWRKTFLINLFTFLDFFFLTAGM